MASKQPAMTIHPAVPLAVMPRSGTRPLRASPSRTVLRTPPVVLGFCPALRGWAVRHAVAAALCTRLPRVAVLHTSARTADCVAGRF